MAIIDWLGTNPTAIGSIVDVYGAPFDQITWRICSGGNRSFDGIMVFEVYPISCPGRSNRFAYSLLGKSQATVLSYN